MTNEALTIQERLKTWNIAGVSIAVIKDFAIEWADGYGYGRPGRSISSLEFLLEMGFESKCI